MYANMSLQITTTQPDCIYIYLQRPFNVSSTKSLEGDKSGFYTIGQVDNQKQLETFSHCISLSFGYFQTTNKLGLLHLCETAILPHFSLFSPCGLPLITAACWVQNSLPSLHFLSLNHGLYSTKAALTMPSVTSFLFIPTTEQLFWFRHSVTSKILGMTLNLV